MHKCKLILFLAIWIGTVLSANIDLIVEDYILSETNENSIIDWNVKFKRINSTTKMLNGSFEFLMDAGDNLKVGADAWQWQGNEFRKIQFKQPSTGFCELRKNDQYIWPDIVKYITMPDVCPVKKGLYYVKEYFPTVKNVPQYFNGKYKILAYIRSPNGKESTVTVIATFRQYVG